MIIRQAKLEDLLSIMEIIEQARRTMRELGTDQWQYGYPNRDVLAADIEAGHCYVAEEAGNLLGLAVIKPGPDASYSRIDGSGWINSSDRYWVVHRLAVRGDTRRNGVAAGLLDFAEQCAAAAGCRSVRVDTHRGNIPMQRLLEKNGYLACGLVDIGPGTGDMIRIGYEKMTKLTLSS